LSWETDLSVMFTILSGTSLIASIAAVAVSTLSLTVSPVPRALTCGAALPSDSALYDVSIRQLTSLHSGFLQTPPRGDALAFG
jgi:hypothetical protein